MQTRRNFVLGGIKNLAAFTLGGGLVLTGREHARTAIRNYNNPQAPQQIQDPDLILVPKQIADKAKLPPINVDQATDVVVGGVAGVAVTQVITGSLRRRQLSSSLSFAKDRLHHVEEVFLPRIQEVLLNFLERNDIPYKILENSGPIGSTLYLIDTVLVHVNAQRSSVQPFINELRALREMLALPLAEKLSLAGEEAHVEKVVEDVFKGDRLRAYLETTFVNALGEDGCGERICANIVNSLEGKELVTEEGLASLRQAVTSIFQSDSFKEKLRESIKDAFGSSNFAENFVNPLINKIASEIKDGDPSLEALREVLKDAIENVLDNDDESSVYEAIENEVEKALRNSDLAEQFVSALADKITNGEIKDDDPNLEIVRKALQDALDRDDVSETLEEGIQNAINSTDLEVRLVNALAGKITNGELKDDDPCLVTVRKALQGILESGTIVDKLSNAISDAISKSDLARTLIKNIIEKFKGDSQSPT